MLVNFCLTSAITRTSIRCFWGLSQAQAPWTVPKSQCATCRGQSTALRLGQSPSVQKANRSAAARTPPLYREGKGRAVADALRLDLDQPAAFFADGGQALACAFAAIADGHRRCGRIHQLMRAIGRTVLNLRQHPRIAKTQLAGRCARSTAAHRAQLPQPAFQRLQQCCAIRRRDAVHSRTRAQRQKSGQNHFGNRLRHDANIPSFTCFNRRDPNLISRFIAGFVMASTIECAS